MATRTELALRKELRYCLTKAREWRTGEGLPNYYKQSWNPKIANQLFWFYIQLAASSRAAFNRERKRNHDAQREQPTQE